MKITPKEFCKIYPDKNFGDTVFIRRDFRIKDGIIIEDCGWEICLPHSCGEWVIGNVSAAKQIIIELEEAIEFINNNPP